MSECITYLTEVACRISGMLISYNSTVLILEISSPTDSICARHVFDFCILLHVGSHTVYACMPNILYCACSIVLYTCVLHDVSCIKHVYGHRIMHGFNYNILLENSSILI